MATHTFTGEPVTVAGRQYTLDITSGQGEPLYDIVDGASGLILTDESLDYRPTAGDVTNLLSDLREALHDGCLPDHLQGQQDLIEQITGMVVS